MALYGHIEGDVNIAGALTAASMNIPDNAVTDATVLAGTGIGAAKLDHQFAKVVCQESDTTCTDEAYVAHVGYGAGSVISFKAGVIVACAGTCDIAVELLKNGVTVLNAAAAITTSQTARALVTAAIGTAAYVAGDVFEIAFDETTAGAAQGKGAFAEVILREAAS